jgi:hypothetical protein
MMPHQLPMLVAVYYSQPYKIFQSSVLSFVLEGLGRQKIRRGLNNRKRRIKEETKEESGSSRNGSFSQG